MYTRKYGVILDRTEMSCVRAAIALSGTGSSFYKGCLALSLVRALAFVCALSCALATILVLAVAFAFAFTTCEWVVSIRWRVSSISINFVHQLSCLCPRPSIGVFRRVGSHCCLLHVVSFLKLTVQNGGRDIVCVFLSKLLDPIPGIFFTN